MRSSSFADQIHFHCPFVAVVIVEVAATLIIEEVSATAASIILYQYQFHQLIGSLAEIVLFSYHWNLLQHYLKFFIIAIMVDALQVFVAVTTAIATAVVTFVATIITRVIFASRLLFS